MDRSAFTDERAQTPAPASATLQELLSPWPPMLGVIIDALLLLAVVALPVLAAAGVSGGLREIVAVAVLAVAPGWGAQRAFGVPPSTFTAIAGITLSVCLTMLVGLIAVTRFNWHWAAALVLIAVVAFAGLAVSLLRFFFPTVRVGPFPKVRVWRRRGTSAQGPAA